MSKHLQDQEIAKLAHRMTHTKHDYSDPVGALKDLLGLITGPEMDHVGSCRACREKLTKDADAEKAALQVYFMPLLGPVVAEIVRKTAAEIVERVLDQVTVEMPVPRKVIEAMAESVKSCDHADHPESGEHAEETLRSLHRYLEMHYPTLN